MACFTDPLYLASAMPRDATLTALPVARMLGYDVENDITDCTANGEVSRNMRLTNFHFT